MNKKGTSIGLIVISFVGIIVALALLVPIADTTGDMRNTRTATLANYTTSATGNGTVTLIGREIIGSIIVVNASDNSEVWTSNFSIVSTNAAGSLAILLETSDDAVTAGQNDELVSVTYSFKPQGYSDSSGSRSMIGLVIVFAALTIMAFAYGPVREALGNIGIGN